MSEIATSIFIAAKPDRIWKQLIGFSRFAEWNPFILSIDGQRGLGEKVLLKLRGAAADGRMADRDISARIIKWEGEHEIRWGHGSWIPGWMDFEHWVRIAPCKDGANVHHCMRVSGLLAGLLRPDYVTMFEFGFAAMIAALKDVVETLEAARPPAAVFANDNTGARRAHLTIAVAPDSFTGETIPLDCTAPTRPLPLLPIPNCRPLM